MAKFFRILARLLLVLLAAAVIVVCLCLFVWVYNMQRESVSERYVESDESTTLDQYKALFRDLVFEDDFEGETLNTDIWKLRASSEQEEGQLQLFTADPQSDNILVKDGNLILHAFPAANGTITSAALTTEGNKTFRYGRFEMVAKLPASAGSLPLFGMEGQMPFLPPEMDLPEFLYTGQIDLVRGSSANNRPLVSQGLRIPAGFTTHFEEITNTYKPKTDLSEYYHTYGFIWTSKELMWYLDRQIMVRIDLSSDEYDFLRRYSDYLVLNLGVLAEDGAGYDDSFIIDSIRIYQ